MHGPTIDAPSSLMAAPVLALALMLALAPPAQALESFDFETPYLVHPGNQVWDFCTVRDGGVVHMFYHTIPQQDAHPANADTIWHAVSADLRHWDITGPVLTAGPDGYDSVAMWAPDVVWDEASGRWAMLYTGVTEGMVQRACLAWSDDLLTWNKSAANPVFEPDSLTYHWAPDQAWSSFRDPYVYHDGSQWNMLSTAALRLGGYPGYRRGIVHRAVSPDLVNWTDAGVFYEHDGAVGRTRDLESVQYVVRDGWHHLFFVEQDLELDSHPTSHMVAADPSGWTMAARVYVDGGWAPELEAPGNITLASPHTEIFARLAKDKDPRDGTWFVTARFDSVRFDAVTGEAEIIMVDPLSGADGMDDWPVRVGQLALAGCTFGDNPVLRGDLPSGLEGHGWISSGEMYGGPLGDVGFPGMKLSDAAVGRLESRAFDLTGGIIRLKIGGGYYPETLYVALLDAADGSELSRVFAAGPTEMAERLWDVSAYIGQAVRLAIVDDEIGPGGWIAVDGIEERIGSLAGVEERAAAGGALWASPNPCNGGTVLRFTAPEDGALDVAVFDLRGRRVWRTTARGGPGDEVAVHWNARDAAGRPLPSGVYFARVSSSTGLVAQARLMLVK